jgi:glycosyltransferase involved in cell wall biosynthesis
MKKRLLFINGRLDSGGVAKSMVTLLNVIDKVEYDVHLLLLSALRGPFFSSLPQDITIHHDERIEGLVDGLSGLKKLWQNGHYHLALASLIRMLLSKCSRSAAGVLLAQLMPRLYLGNFDVIIDYGGQHLLYYMVDKLEGNKKISYFHSDYAKWSYYYRADKKYLKKVDRVVVVTEVAKQSMLRYFPFLTGRISIIENIVIPSQIESQAQEPFAEKEFFEHHFVLLTVGHVCQEKGFDLALKAATILQSRGLDFQWVFIGSYKESHIRLIKSRGLKNHLHLFGVRKNPFPYMKHAQIIVHPSRFESQPLVVSEAKLLCKPIVVTRFSTVPNILIKDVNASVCEMNADSLADSIETLARSFEIRQKYTEYLKKHITDNSKEISKLYSLF